MQTRLDHHLIADPFRQSQTAGQEEAAQPHASQSSAKSYSVNRRALFVKWLRKTHGWIGMWGAALGLLFGTTGIFLNHRTVLKIPVGAPQESTLQLELPTPAPKSPQAMAIWLQQELAFDRPATRVKGEPPKPVAWGDKELKQPARWSAVLSSPKVNFQAEYWVGNNFVSIKRSDNNFIGLLNNLHKGNGLGVGWILLVDTLAGSIILLSLTGVLLWVLTTRHRMIGTGIGVLSTAVALGIALQSM